MNFYVLTKRKFRKIPKLEIAVQRLIFTWIHFRKGKLSHISRGFILADKKILITSSGLIFAAAVFALVPSHALILKKVKFIAKLS